MSSQEKLQNLERIKAKLKREFIGLDSQIDYLIQYVTPWYVCPEILTRPLVVTLWGLTGTGKTAVVKRFLELALPSTKNYRYLNVAHGAGAEKDLIDEIFYEQEKALSMHIPAALVLDEFDKMIQNDDQRNQRSTVDNLWEFLNTGTISLQKAWHEVRAEVNYALKRMEINKLRKLEEKNQSEEDKKQKDLEGLSLDLDDLLDEDTDSSLESNKSIFASEYSLRENIHLYEVLYSKDHKDLFTMTKAQSIRFVLNTKPKFLEFRAEKMLVFIIGNLNSAFYGAKNVQEADLPADYLYKKTKAVNKVKIKQNLTKTLEPEQISRLGNNFIIYPSLSESSYKKIIKKEVNNFTKYIKNTFQKKLNIKSAVYDLLYKEAVFPTQGVRPVFSSVSSVLAFILPDIITLSLEKKFNTYSVDYILDCFVISAEGEVLKEIEYEGDLHLVRTRNNEDEHAITAVHEAGHALVYSLVTGFLPQFANITLATSNQGLSGFALVETVSSTLKTTLQQLKVSLAGTLAEELVFGATEVSTGATADLENATVLASTLIRECGLSKFRALGQFNEDNDVGKTYVKPSTFNDHDYIYELLQEQKLEVVNLLKENVELLKDLSRCLFENKTMDEKEFKEFFNAQKHKPELKYLKSLSNSNDLIKGYKEVLFEV